MKLKDMPDLVEAMANGDYRQASAVRFLQAILPAYEDAMDDPEDDLENLLAFCLADARHAADAFGADFFSADRRARDHYQAECVGESA